MQGQLRLEKEQAHSPWLTGSGDTFGARLGRRLPSWPGSARLGSVGSAGVGEASASLSAY